MATAATKFRIDVSIHNLLQDSNGQKPRAAEPKGLTLPTPVFPQYPDRLNDPGPERPPEGNRKWGVRPIARAMRGWLYPYMRSRVLPGDFHPITSYLFVEYKCNLDCWYCWSFDNRIKGMTEDVARRSIDWLYDHGCRVLACMGGEPLLRPDFIHKVVYYAAKKGFWVYIATNGRLLKPELADRLGDAGVAVFNFALDSWELKPSLPKAFVPAQTNLEHILRKQYVYDYLVFFNINICRNNLEDVKLLTEYAHDHHIATDYHINETPMLEQDEHFKHLSENPTYFRPADWGDLDRLIDWIIEKNKAGYQMVNSVQRLEEMKTFVRMSSGLNIRDVGWNADGNASGAETAEMLKKAAGIVQGEDGELGFGEWNCRAGQNNVIIRTDGTVAPCFPMYSASFDWGNIDQFSFDRDQLDGMKKTCQKHCFSTLNHNLAYCYNDARVIKWMWENVKRGFRGGVRSFED
jgi:MoaA/NifB/PqqE/SkfB family radical SAM enzyme